MNRVKHVGMGGDMALDFPDSAGALLLPHLMHGGWEVDLAPKKLFATRGLSTFRREFGPNVTELAKFIPEMRETLSALSGWDFRHLKWAEDFSPRQINAAYSKTPVSFEKAAQLILLCAVAADSRHKAGNLVNDGNYYLKFLTIEPRVYFVHDFSPAVLEQVNAKDSGFWDRLRDYCQQGSSAVFKDMAYHGAKSRVTLNLAQIVKAKIKANFGINLGKIDSFVSGKLTINDKEALGLDYSTLLTPKELERPI
jgi:hypothetical protein